jgi:hypothetical protein
MSDMKTTFPPSFFSIMNGTASGRSVAHLGKIVDNG